MLFRFMSPLFAAALSVAAAVLPARLAAAPHPARSATATWSAVWHDAKRDRDVPVKIYHPVVSAASSSPPAKLPVILFSHGLGGNREGYAYLGTFWAARGYVGVHVQHLGSDDAVLRGPGADKAIRAAVTDPQIIRQRPLDLVFALDQLEKLAADPAFVLHGRLDLSRVGAAGHSYGAFTAMALSGWHPGVPGIAADDPRIKAVVAMSTPAARRDDPAASGYASVRLPVLHLTGTEDADAVGGTPADRRIPHDRTAAAPSWLLTLTGGNHMVFASPPGTPPVGADPSPAPDPRALILIATTRFWDAFLKDDASARAWLDGDGLPVTAGNLAKVERKRL